MQAYRDHWRSGSWQTPKNLEQETPLDERSDAQSLFSFLLKSIYDLIINANNHQVQWTTDGTKAPAGLRQWLELPPADTK